MQKCIDKGGHFHLRIIDDDDAVSVIGVLRVTKAKMAVPAPRSSQSEGMIPVALLNMPLPGWQKPHHGREFVKLGHHPCKLSNTTDSIVMSPDIKHYACQ